ncbi:RagB/SusD family nutrient uptake outer membrane protein [Mucilaginibacter mali]|uniref:RagB/SusD family nutrient uptake outer membrane protein n=1 Tax=Mucilaginibacter mali TaxID=2740462 RepID=A0A7D4QA60_9SPHI|nr:RagB/SusD family nutrient uptake outer membrane protein [Mucilaginibacter mali]QKJ30585.1 RagB/SusD family nutrient uptake outer membrane protein [Mucilaginibacter mali]
MKNRLYILLLALMVPFASCKKNLDVPPLNIITDKDVFGSVSGIDAYMSRIYLQMPIEDFKYQSTTGFKAFFAGSASANTGEAISRDVGNSTETFNYWADAYALIRDCNYFMETLPTYAGNFSAVQVANWQGEARYIRAVTYFALVKRYGGVPLVDKVLTKPGETIDDIVAEIEQFKIPRSSEQAGYDFIGTDLDFAYTNLPATNVKGRATKYAAAALKSRVMLYAGTIAKYNTINLTGGGAQVCGIPATKANDYFKAAYDAATLLDGKFSLYKTLWSATDKAAQANNFAQLFLDVNSAENIFVRQYKYPDADHWYDNNQIPHQMWNGTYSAETCPTLDFVEMYEGLPTNPNGTFQSLDAAGHYIMYTNPGDPFANIEPRAKGTILFPGDAFKGQIIDLRRGIYTGSTTAGLNKLVPATGPAQYPAAPLILSSATDVPAPVDIGGGKTMNPAGSSGYFTSTGTAGCISGFTIRKYLDPTKATTDLANNRSDQAWIELRYAEVLLNRAEAAIELFTAGQGANYQTQALADINAIRDRAGATLATTATLNIAAVRKERRKELAFENKTWFDLRRWRIADTEMNNRYWRILNQFYVKDAAKYIYDDRQDERNTLYTFDPRWYYEAIPGAVISKSPNIVQNPGY